MTQTSLLNKNKLQNKWHLGKTAFGVWCYLNNDLAMEMVASQNPDYILVDLQHGVADVSQAINMMRAAQLYGTNPLLRVPHCDTELIGKCLDGGASGIVVPMVESTSVAEHLIRACRYPPQGGIRSFGPVRASVLQNTLEPEALGNTVAIAMIETIKGIEHVNEIANTPGLSGIYIGSVDLSISLGIGPKMPSEDTRFVSAIHTIKKACEAAGIIAGLHCPNGMTGKVFAEQGYRMITVATDIELLKNGCAENIMQAKG